jgi:hypothetical protein
VRLSALSCGHLILHRLNGRPIPIAAVKELGFGPSKTSLTGMCRKWICFWLVLFSLVSSALARDVFEVESRYLGDGWMLYSVRTLPDPFFKVFTISHILPFSTNSSSFPGFVEATPPEHWTNNVSPTWNGIAFDFSVTQPRTNETTFLVHSSETHFRRGGRCLAIVYVEFNDNYINTAGGYVSSECLIPCTAEEADGSQPKLTTRLELIKDITIDELVRTNHQVYGVKYSWQEASTVDLEGSHNLKDWNFISRIFGNPPQTTWITNTPLNSFGKFFRLSLVANGHLTDTLNRAITAPMSIEVSHYKFAQGQLQGEFASVPGTAYTASLCKRNGDLLETRQVTATDTSTTVGFPLDKAIEGVIRVTVQSAITDIKDAPQSK